MTQNQIAYWNLQETKRSNESREKETNRHNVVTETEDKRHNLSTEGESFRHNTATEGEASRHNIASEQFNISQLNEAIRHNMVTEQQTDRANAIKEYANVINEAYNDAIVKLRAQELDLNQQKELQRIEESQRDFNEGVRINDAKLIIDAFDSGSNAVRTIFGNKGLIDTALVGTGIAASQLAPKLLKSTGAGKGVSQTYPKAQAVQTVGSAASAGTMDLFLIPDAALEIFKNTQYGNKAVNGLVQ